MSKYIRKLLGFSDDSPDPVHPELARMMGLSETLETLADIKAKLASKHIDDRRNACYALGECKEKGAYPLLKDLLNDRDLEVRVYAIQALKKHSNKTTVPLLCELFARKQHRLIYSNALAALAEFRDERAIPTLISLLSSSQPFIRYDAAHALGEIGHLDAVESLKAIVNDKTMPEEDGEQSTSWSVGTNAKKAIAKIQKANRKR